ncbi:MAG: hypothetical protein ACJASL_004734 [Paraglaciecola sp.]|jgi:hypothetical protein
MLDCGNPTNIEKVLFENEHLAETFLSKKLAKLSAYTQQTDNISGN